MRRPGRHPRSKLARVALRVSNGSRRRSSHRGRCSFDCKIGFSWTFHARTRRRSTAQLSRNSRTPPAGGQAGSSLGTCRGGLRIAEAYASNAPRPVAFPGSGARAARRHQKQSRAEVRCGTLPSVAHASHTKERVLAWGTPKRNGIFGQSLPARNGSNPVALNGRTLVRIP
jgi:hypothetical protein